MIKIRYRPTSSLFKDEKRVALPEKHGAEVTPSTGSKNCCLDIEVGVHNPAIWIEETMEKLPGQTHQQDRRTIAWISEEGVLE